MHLLYVLKSKKLQTWGHSVGITKYLFKFGLTKLDLKDLIQDLNSRNYAGKDDWALILKKKTEYESENKIIEKLGETIEVLNPDFYPQIGNSIGIFRVKKEMVENSIIIRNALKENDKLMLSKKIKDKDFAEFILSKVNI